MIYPNTKFALRLRALLGELDELEQTDELMELNATLEDVILLIEDTSPEDDEWEEEINDAYDELDDLYISYSKINGLFPYSERLKDITEKSKKGL